MVMASWNKLTYHRRLFFGLVIYSWVLVSCFAIFQYHREKEFKAAELNGRLQLINLGLLRQLEDGGTARTDHLPFENLRISIFDRSGQMIYDNSLTTLPTSSHIGREEIAKAMKHGEGFTTRRSNSVRDEGYFYSATRGDIYIVRTAVPYSTSLSQLLAADITFLRVMAGITLVMCVAGFFATRRVGQNISRLGRFAEMAERGERIVDTEPFPHDELGEISNHIVRLYSRLQNAIAERDMEHRAALREEQEKIRIKRQLTNNINHELKTPVASMQACLETLMAHPGMAPERREEFIGRCYASNERLRRLLADVSAITRMEDGGDNICRESVNLAEIVAEICDDYALMACEKRISITNTIIYDGPMRGNPSLLASIFRNLIDNALSYSCGSAIELRQEGAGGDYVTITVRDNGTGVAPEHLPRLFERFYRVDKGRSRREGGTGLGLAIVKNAVIWHGGTIFVRNRAEGGLSFRFRLRK